jgi:hypothetical protein
MKHQLPAGIAVVLSLKRECLNVVAPIPVRYAPITLFFLWHPDLKNL